MNIGDLATSGSSQFVEKTVTHAFTDPKTGEERAEEVQFSVKVMTFGDHLDMHKLIEGGMDENTALITTAVWCDQGGAKMTPEMVSWLPLELVPLVASAVDEVNQFGKKNLLLRKNLPTASPSQE